MKIEAWTASSTKVSKSPIPPELACNNSSRSKNESMYMFPSHHLQPSYFISFVFCGGYDGSQAIQTNSTENASRVFDVGTHEKVLIGVRDFCFRENDSGNDWDREPVLEPEVQEWNDDVLHSRFHDGLENQKQQQPLKVSLARNNKATKIMRKNAHRPHLFAVLSSTAHLHDGHGKRPDLTPLQPDGEIVHPKLPCQIVLTHACLASHHQSLTQTSGAKIQVQFI